MTEKERLRQEFTVPSFRAMLEVSLSHECCNCGSTEGIEYHHIVPIAFGGTNRLSNIVPLCGRCHKAAHFGQHLSHYRTPNYTGRPKLFTDELAEKVLPLYACGEITRAECHKQLGLGRTSKLQDNRTYTEFLKRHGLKSIYNSKAMAARRTYPECGKVICRVVGDDTNPFELCVKEGEVESAKDFLRRECGMVF